VIFLNDLEFYRHKINDINRLLQRWPRHFLKDQFQVFEPENRPCQRRKAKKNSRWQRMGAEIPTDRFAA
jgi:hypothetical protein